MCLGIWVFGVVLNWGLLWKTTVEKVFLKISDQSIDQSSRDLHRLLEHIHLPFPDINITVDIEKGSMIMISSFFLLYLCCCCSLVFFIHAEVLTTIIHPDEEVTNEGEHPHPHPFYHHPHEFRPFQTSNRSQVVIFVNTTEKRCFMEDKLNVIFRYEFQENIDYTNDLRLQLYNIHHELISETSYQYDQLHLISLPVTIFDHGVNVIHSKFIDVTTQTILDNQTTFFIQPCFPSPSALEYYVVNPVVDHKAALLLSSSGMMIAGKFLFENYDQVKDQLMNLKWENIRNIFQSNGNQGVVEDPAFEHFRRFVNHKLIEANPNIDLNNNNRRPPPAPSAPALPPSPPTALLLSPTSSVIPPQTATATAVAQKVTFPAAPTQIQQQQQQPPRPLAPRQQEGPREGGMVQNMLKNKIAWKVMGLVSGVLLLSSAAKLSFSIDDLPIPTRNIFSPLSSASNNKRNNNERSRKSFLLGSKLSFGAFNHPSLIRDLKAFGRTLSFTKEKMMLLQQRQGNDPRLFARLDQSDAILTAQVPLSTTTQQQQKGIPSSMRMWKSVAAVVLQTGMILFQNNKHEQAKGNRVYDDFPHDNVQW